MVSRLCFGLAPVPRPFPRKGARPGEHPTLSIRKICKLRRFTVAHKHGMWLVQFNGWVKGQSQTGLNRHRRGYATKEAASGVHFQGVGSYRARPVSTFKFPSFIIIILIIITSWSSSFLRSYLITTDIIALSIAYDPTLVIRDIKENLVIKPYHMHLGIKQLLLT